MSEQLCMQGLGVSACFRLECCYLIYHSSNDSNKGTLSDLWAGKDSTWHANVLSWLVCNRLPFAFAALHDRQHIMFKCLGRAALDVLLMSAHNSTVH
jgi:hypothetical protein